MYPANTDGGVTTSVAVPSAAIRRWDVSIYILIDVYWSY